MMYFRETNDATSRTLKAIDFDTSLPLSVEVDGVDRASFWRKIECLVGTLRYESPEIGQANRCNSLHNANAQNGPVWVILIYNKITIITTNKLSK
jgi:hypothetical protein